MSKTILVTGTGYGFGNLIAKSLADQGHGVIAVIDKEENYNLKMMDELKSTPNIEIINTNLTNENSLSNSVHQILHKYGSIDVLINSPEVKDTGSLEATSISHIKRILDISLFNVIRTIQAVLPSMRKNKYGTILNVCCGPSLFSLPFLIPQTLSKMGIIALSEGLQTELKYEGVDCISILIENYVLKLPDYKSLKADLPDITGAYKIESKMSLHEIQRSISEHKYAKTDYQQSLVDKILNVLTMKHGTRPGMIFISEGESTIRSGLNHNKNPIKK